MPRQRRVPDPSDYALAVAQRAGMPAVKLLTGHLRIDIAAGRQIFIDPTSRAPAELLAMVPRRAKAKRA